ncbi:hypothetical protein HDU67_007962 [Dinochytrium kinnereticum]|nr:hypothetical protein HDU67_007962 [Dinochytrium kinnereticum]
MKSKRNRLLGRVREILEDVSGNTVEVDLVEGAGGKAGGGKGKSGGKGSSMNEVRFPKCHISVQASAVMDVVDELLAEAAKSDPQTLRKQRDLVQSMLSESSTITDGEKRFDAIEYSVETCVGHLLNLGKIWRPISQTQLYLDAMGLLVDDFLAGIVREIQPVAGGGGQALHRFRFLVGVLLKLENVFQKRGAGGGWEKVPVQQFSKRWNDLVDFLQELS